jgi:hypothetical protein
MTLVAPAAIVPIAYDTRPVQSLRAPGFTALETLQPVPAGQARNELVLGVGGKFDVGVVGRWEAETSRFEATVFDVVDAEARAGA